MQGKAGQEMTRDEFHEPHPDLSVKSMQGKAGQEKTRDKFHEPL